jgi:hypothetical protein
MDPGVVLDIVAKRYISSLEHEPNPDYPAHILHKGSYLQLLP